MEELAILFPALAVGLLMMLIHVPLGQEVLKRGIVFIDLSLAQLAAMGAIFAALLDFNYFFTQLFALLFAILGGLLFFFIEKNYREITEAIIGCVFVLSATLVILVMSSTPHGAEHINDILSGQLLFVTKENVIFAGTIFLTATFLIYKYPQVFLKKYFYLTLSIIITTSVQICGVYLVFASLIFPAVATSYITNNKKRRIIEYLGETFGFIFGLTLSFYLDLPAGPAVVWGISFMIPVCLWRKVNTPSQP